MSFGSNIKLNPLITKCVIPKQFIFKSGVCDVSVQTIGYELWSIFWYSLHFIQIILVIFLFPIVMTVFTLHKFIMSYMLLTMFRTKPDLARKFQSKSFVFFIACMCVISEKHIFINSLYFYLCLNFLLCCFFRQAFLC